MTEMIWWHELAADLPVPVGQTVEVFRFSVQPPSGPRALRVGLQGAAYLNTHLRSAGLTLRTTIGRRTVIITPSSVVLPTGGAGMPATYAEGEVRFEISEDFVPPPPPPGQERPPSARNGEDFTIPAGASLMRGGSERYMVTTDATAEDGVALVHARAMTAGTAGNCPAGASFMYTPVPNGPPLTGFAQEPGFTNGRNASPSADQFMIKTGTGWWLVDTMEGHPQVQIIVTMTNDAALPMEVTSTWMLCGVTSGVNLGIDRWPWRCIVEDLGAPL